MAFIFGLLVGVVACQAVNNQRAGDVEWWAFWRRDFWL